MSIKLDDVGAARDQLTKDFRTLVADAEDLLRLTSSLSGQGVDAAREKLARNIEEMRAKIAPAQSYAMECTKEAVDTVITTVRERPWQTLAVVMLVGLVVGVLSTSSRKD